MGEIRYSGDIVDTDWARAAQQVWPGAYGLAEVSSALARTTNIGAWDDERLVGTVRVLSDGYFFATILEILVLPAYRRRGIGRELMSRALEVAPRGKLFLGAQPQSIGFFEHLGYSRGRSASSRADRRIGRYESTRSVSANALLRAVPRYSQRMALRETEGSLRAYFVVVGIISVLTGLRDQSDLAALDGIELPFDWLLALYVPLVTRFVLGVGSLPRVSCSSPHSRKGLAGSARCSSSPA